MKKRENTVILVSGYKRSGKDFVSNILQNELKDSVKYSYAYPLKKILADSFGISVEELENYKNIKANIDVPISFVTYKRLTDFRALLQVFGTEAMKQWFGANVWSDLFIKQDLKQKYIIIPDWRFKLEYEEAKKYYKNVITLRVNDNNISNTDTHSSETELEGYKFDYIIDNTKKDESILEEIDKFIKEAL